ncbi:cupin domain-containing protein [Flavivirga sp. 57AJ16]|uniref:cupin domain-containing protein n=1 Tax=Flavivirga sp. 57AJ16 TaxID=3025307 RepID=UPI00236595F5|nr:cupin domain-containing protein [Flavivirga sp. 57AJ16]MDD7886202.1 cupin domain-containing protein [Flavivirga sp. 57AJ16]
MNYFEDTLEDNATVVLPHEGNELNINEMILNFKITSNETNDQLGIYKITLPPKSIGAKLHYHRFMDETFMVTEGIVTIEAGTEEYKGDVGTIVYVPRLTPHAFRNDTNKPASITLIFNPAQKREGFFKGLYETLNETPINPEKYLKLYNKYDSFPVDKSNMLPVYKE